MNKLSERLKTLRKNKNLSQQEIANKLDVSRVAYTNWENGNREPNYDNLIKLSIILEASTDYLLGNTNIDILSNEYNIEFKNYLEEKYKKELSEDPLFYSKLVKSEQKNNSNTLETTQSKSNNIDNNEKY